VEAAGFVEVDKGSDLLMELEGSLVFK
jgi:hypothetical protein